MKPGAATYNMAIVDQGVTGSIALVPVTNITTPINANEKRRITIRGTINTGATGGFRFNLSTPAGFTRYNCHYRIVDITTPKTFETVQAAPADFTDANAVDTDYIFLIEAEIINGATAGDVVLNFAQNNATGDQVTVTTGMVIESVNI